MQGNLSDKKEEGKNGKASHRAGAAASGKLLSQDVFRLATTHELTRRPAWLYFFVVHTDLSFLKRQTLCMGSFFYFYF